VTIDAAKSVTATFVPLVRLTVAVSGTSQPCGFANQSLCYGYGSVHTSAPDVNCSITANGVARSCWALFPAGTTVSLYEVHDGSSGFGGWGGACAGFSSPCQVVMSSDQSVSASFTPVVVPNPNP
jgi:hypothetical protein